MRQSIAPLLDNLGVTIDLGDNEHITETIVISKVVGFTTGETRLSICSSGIDWISKIGLVRAAARIVDSDIERVEGDS